MELLRELGVESVVRRQTPPLNEWRHFRYSSSILGPQIAAQDHIAGSAWTDLCDATAAEMAHLSQPKLESILHAEAVRRAPSAGGSLLTGYECIRFEQSASGVRAELRRVDGSTREGDGAADGAAAGAVLHVEAEHLLACDGAHSSVRRALGLRLRGPPPLQYFKSVHFTAPDLAPLIAHHGREAMLHFCFNRGAVAVLVAHNIAEGEWVAQLPYFPGLQDGDTLDKHACTATIAACIGGGTDAGSRCSPLYTTSADPAAASAVPFEVRSIGSWAMSAKVAQRLSLGRVHLLGDAAHQFPPAGAFGANTGLQDAHNLCWKIGAVHAGTAGDALIKSYDLERRPVALANARLSVHNYHRGLRVAIALGLPSELPHTLAAVASGVRTFGANLSLPPLPSPPASLLGSGGGDIAKRLGSRLLELGRSSLIDGLGHAASHPLGRWRLDCAREVIEAGRALPLLFARHELGFVYPPMPGLGGGDAHSGGGGGGSDAQNRAAEAAEAAEAEAWAEAGAEARIEDEVYVPSSRVGARLPHHWLRCDAGGDAGSVRLSTHDLLHDAGGAAGGATSSAISSTMSPALPEATPPRLTLLFDQSEGAHWAAGAARLPAASKHMRLVAIATADPRHDPPPPGASAVDRIVRDPCGGWASKRQVAACGAILVRPDGHVAWRCEQFADGGDAAAAEEMLRDALAATLALPQATFAM